MKHISKLVAGDSVYINSKGEYVTVSGRTGHHYRYARSRAMKYHQPKRSNKHPLPYGHTLMANHLASSFGTGFVSRALNGQASNSLYQDNLISPIFGF